MLKLPDQIISVYSNALLQALLASCIVLDEHVERGVVEPVLVAIFLSGNSLLVIVSGQVVVLVQLGLEGKVTHLLHVGEIVLDLGSVLN